MQIYYDFSGYSDIAIGLSKVFGFNVAENFNFPYRSLSITEFWRRWHISLGNWFKEYVYIPLGGNRKGKKRTLCNLFIVFFITGVWHGAGMGYLFWGVLHGVCVLGERCLKDTSFYNKIPSYIKWLATMIIVLIGWEFFRLGSFGETINFLKVMFGFNTMQNINFTFQYFFSKKIIILAAMAMAGATIPGKLINKVIQADISKNIIVIKQIVYIVLLVVVIICIVNSTYSPFIYFNY